MSTMNWRAVTSALLVCLAAAMGIYDVIAVWRGGGRATISSVVLDTARAYPILAIAFGILIGHLFWPQKVAP